MIAAVLATLLALGPAIAARLHPVPVQKLLEQAEALLAQEQFLAGIDLFEKAARRSNDTPGLYLDLAIACERGMFALGQREPELRIELFRRMMDAYREASARFPEDGYVAASYAAACSMTEYLDIPVNVEEATSAWLHCLELREKRHAERPTPFREQELIMPLLHLGRLALSSGDLVNARCYLERVRQITPESPVVANLLDRLAAAEASSRGSRVAG